MAFMCAESMKAAFPDWIQYRVHKDCPKTVKAEILQTSASAIGRFLKGERSDLQRNLNRGTKRDVRRFVRSVPVRDLEHSSEALGRFEIECVAHCGGISQRILRMEAHRH
jgi:hypothetical protein